MEDVNISIYRASVVREGSTPASPGFVVSDGQNPVDPSGSGQNHLPVTIATAATGLSITESQVLGGAGNVGQYIRGDGSLADFPESSGGGSSVSYYLNGSVAQGTIGGVAYKELNKVPILGAGTDFTINADGYIASFITDAGDPNLLEIPGGNWNFETYFSASSSGGTPSFYVELYKVNSGGTATLIASNSGFPELIAFGTNIISYFSTLAVPTTTLALTDRLAVRYYVTHSGRTITLHTEDNHLCQIVTTFTTGITALNGLTAQVQNFAVGTSGTDFNIASATATHTFNLPTASATNRGALSSADWTTFNSKQNALTNPVTGTGSTNFLPKFTGSTTIGNSLFTDNGTNGGIGGANYASGTDLRSFNISAPLYAGLGFWANNQYAADIFGYGVSGNLILSADPTNIFSDSRVILVTDGTQRFAVFSNGNVSIGNSPIDNGVKLHVSGTATVTSSITALNGILSGTGSAFADGLRVNRNSNTNQYTVINHVGGATNIVSVDQSGNNIAEIYFGRSINGSTISNSMMIDKSGNVGIGTASPSTGLHLSGTGAFPVLRLARTDSSSIMDLGFGLGDAASNVFTLIDRTAGVNRFNITSGGNVGIGTVSPNLTAANRTVLDINGTNNSLLVFSSGGTYKSYIYNDGVGLTLQASTLQFETSFVPRIHVTSGGNVLIGTTTDAGQKLQVTGNLLNTVGNNVLVHRVTGATTGYIYAYWTNTSGQLLYGVEGSTPAQLQTGSSAYDAVITTASTSSLSIGVNQVQAIKIVNGGSVFIGSSSDPNASVNGIGLYPNGEIDISRSSGTTCVFNRNTTNGQIVDFRYNNTQVGSISTNSNSLPSDFNFKKNITDISIGLNLVAKLRPVHYRHKMDKDYEALSNGIIAQELEQALLDCGIEKNSLLMLQHKPNEKEGESQYWVDYTKMIPVLIKSIQELKQEIDTLKN